MNKKEISFQEANETVEWLQKERNLWYVPAPTTRDTVG